LPHPEKKKRGANDQRLKGRQWDDWDLMEINRCKVWQQEHIWEITRRPAEGEESKSVHEVPRLF
jgi:hypothetical protein